MKVSAPDIEPPTIPGLTPLDWLGSGGFADVFLYSQASPSRRVAVKVLRDPEVTSTAVNTFLSEADAMARLEHPHIVPVFTTGTTADGRPYIVMMHYPRPSLAQRIGTHPITLAETLQLGIQIGSAVETAHRAGILHRDIKPANVLTNTYGIPGLTDFGIAGHISADTQTTALSVPWAAPELLAPHPRSSVQSDVYALAATLWQALTGHPPHVDPHGDNSYEELTRRICTRPAPSLNRDEVPRILDRILGAALSPDPGLRPSSARELITSLQLVERGCGYMPTAAQLTAADL